ncbi:hypothetical protein [Streptomyces sp. ATMOS53]
MATHSLPAAFGAWFSMVRRRACPYAAARDVLRHDPGGCGPRTPV